MVRAEHGDEAPAPSDGPTARVPTAAGRRADGSPAGLFSCSLFGTVLGVGTALCRLSGRPAFEVRGTPARQLLQPWSHADLQRVLRAAREGIVSGSATFRFRHADGSGVELPACWSVQPGSGSEPPHVVFVRGPADSGALDTARTEEPVVSLALDATVVVDAQGMLTYVSPAVGDVFGYEADDVAGCDVWSFLHPADATAARAAYLSIVGGRSPRTAILRLRAARGDWRWVKIVAVNRLDDAVGGVVCAVHDITSEVAADRTVRPAVAMAEGTLRLVADPSEEGIWALSAAGETLFANPRMAAILGVRPDQLCDPVVLSSLDPTAAAEVRARLRTRAERGRERYELAYAHPDGRERRLWISATALRAEDGSHEGSLATVADITEVRRAEAWLRASPQWTPPLSRPL